MAAIPGPITVLTNLTSIIKESCDDLQQLFTINFRKEKKNT